MDFDPKHVPHCDCPGCAWTHLKTHSLAYHIFKKIFLLVVIVFVFWLGMRLGQLQTLERDARMGAWQSTPMQVQGGTYQ